eukprot:CAMPEP_0179969816 /NCGR_PEP_ID=MMETSP0983-20121128/34840_1 /TAXON_ID=483367 /ORGANISM="non described non described, Strain CCMP 2436" /LENGTH=35 /DNA_ID= /DNA_START= /DNA_END= /DNA_ORIENTATION=
MIAFLRIVPLTSPNLRNRRADRRSGFPRDPPPRPT